VYSVIGSFGGHAEGDLIALASAFMYTVYLFVTKQLTADARADDWCLCAVELLTLSSWQPLYNCGHDGTPTVLGVAVRVRGLYVGLARPS